MRKTVRLFWPVLAVLVFFGTFSHGLKIVNAQVPPTPEIITGWFSDNSEFKNDNLQISFYGKTKAPEIIVPAKGDRPEITFKLAYIDGEGPSNSLVPVHNLTWYSFDAYAGPTKIDHFYLLSNNDGHDYFYYDYEKDESSVRKGKLNDDIGSVNVIGNAQVNADDLGTLAAYVLNKPTNAGSSNCTDSTGQKITGPKADQQSLLTVGFTQATALKLDQNCLNLLTDADKSWAATWKVPVHESEPFLGGKNDICASSPIFDFSKGVDVVIANTLKCLVVGTIASASKETTDFLTKIGTVSGSLEQNLRDHSDPLVQAWTYARGLVDIIVILALLTIAFTNIFHVSLNLYAIKKSLPALVLGVIGANASLLIMRFLLDTVQALNQLAFEVAKVTDLGTLLQNFINTLGGSAVNAAIQSVSAVASVGILFGILLIIVGSCYFIFLILLFIWAFIKRLIILYVLIVVSPLAFTAYGLPGFQPQFFKWWNTFLQQAFVLPLLLLSIALFNQFGLLLTKGVTPSFDITSKPQNIFAGILLFGLATYILKLPGLVTKGAYDMTKASQKAFGLAKGVPSAMYGTAQAGAAGIQKRYAAKEAIARARGETELANRYKRTADRYKSVAGFAGARRGWAYTVTNPDKTIGAAIKARIEFGEGQSKKEASKVNVGIPGIKDWFGNPLIKARVRNLQGAVQGQGAEYKAIIERNKEDIDAAVSAADAHELLLSDKAKKAFDHILGWANTGDEAEVAKKRARLARLRTGGLKDLEALLNESATPIDLRGADSDKGQLVSGLSAIESARRKLGRGGQTSSFGDTKNPIYTDTQGNRRAGEGGNNQGGGANPFGTGGRGTGGFTPPPGPGGSGASGNVQNVNVVNPVTVQNSREAFAAAKGAEIAAHAQALKESLGEDTQNKLIEHLNSWEQGDATAQANLAEENRRTLLDAIDQNKAGGAELANEVANASADRLKELSQNFSLIASGDRNPAALQERLNAALQASQTVENENANAAGKVELGEQTIRSLVEGSQGNMQQLTEHLSKALGTNFENIQKAFGRSPDAELQQKVMLKLAEQITSSITGRGPKSLATIIKNLGSSMAKESGLQTVELKTALQQKQPDVTNVTNTSVTNEAPAQAPASDITPPAAPPETPPPPAQPPQA